MIKRINAQRFLSVFFGAVVFANYIFISAVNAAPLADPIPEVIKMSGKAIQLETVATGLTAPNWGTTAPGDDSRLFVTDQVGILWAIDLAMGTKTVFLDVSARIVPLGIAGPGTFDERGLLGVAFHPDYENNGLLYTYTSEPAISAVDFPAPLGAVPDHQSVIIEWRVPTPFSASAVVDPTSARVLLRIDEPQFNHNAGAVNFGPDGNLYITVGDGGNADDEGAGHVAQGNGQDPSNILGTVIRIDPTGTNSANGQYGIPADNPFAAGGDGPAGGVAGCADGFCDEIYAYGFRNPFRASFDRKTGDFYVADVGQNDIEEVNVVVAGGNYGWRLKEGSFCFDANGADSGFVTDDAVCGPPTLIDPVAEYDHDEGISVIGGFVYRGDEMHRLRGHYVFGDFSRTFFNNDGRLFFLKRKNIVRKDRIRQSDIREFRIRDQAGLNLAVLGFGQDADGELYVLANATSVPFGVTGVVLRIVSKNVRASKNTRHRHRH